MFEVAKLRARRVAASMTNNLGLSSGIGDGLGS